MTLLQKIDAQSCRSHSCDHKQYLINLDAAFGLIIAKTVPIAEVQDIPLAAASGWVLKPSVRSDDMVPPFDSSALDGYPAR